MCTQLTTVTPSYTRLLSSRPTEILGILVPPLVDLRYAPNREFTQFKPNTLLVGTWRPPVLYTSSLFCFTSRVADLTADIPQ